MASETVDPTDWSHSPPSWAVSLERIVHSINRCSSATAGIRSCNLGTFSIQGNHLAYAATQGGPKIVVTTVKFVWMLLNRGSLICVIADAYKRYECKYWLLPMTCIAYGSHAHLCWPMIKTDIMSLDRIYYNTFGTIGFNKLLYKKQIF